MQVTQNNCDSSAKVFKKDRQQLVQIYYQGADCNQILYDNIPSSQTFTYHLPAYMSFSFDGISEVNYHFLNAKMNCELQFIINVAGLDSFLIQHIKKNTLIYFDCDECVDLNTQKITHLEDNNQNCDIQFGQQIEYSQEKVKHHYLKWEIRKQFNTGLVADVEWTPFQILYLIISASPKIVKNFEFYKYQVEQRSKNKSTDNKQLLVSPELKYRKQQLPKQSPNKAGEGEKSNEKKLLNIKFNFNLMDCKQKSNTMYFRQFNEFGQYRIASKLLKSQFTSKSCPQILSKQSQEINKKKEETIEKITGKKSKKTNFDYAHFTVSIYKQPNSAIVTIFIPILFLSIINLGIFNQNFELGSRIANLGALVLAFVAIQPVIRQQVPPNPRVTKIQILVYMLTGTDLICFIESFIHSNQQTKGSLMQSIFFIISLGVTCFVFATILVLLLMHKLKWEPSYSNINGEIPQSERFQHHKWGNQQCNFHFLNFFDNGQVVPIYRP